MVSTKKPKKNITHVTSSQKQIKKSIQRASNYINKKMSNSDKQDLETIRKQFKDGKDSKSMFTKNGKYSPSRIKIHNKILKFFLSQDRSTKKPDLYILGGPPASGKTSALAKSIREPAVTVNNDDIKFQLAKYTPSPSKRFFLLHAALLHRESKDIENKLIEKLLKSNKDVILDRTLSDFNKNLALAKEFKSKGYEITTFGTNLKPHVAVMRAAKRFIKGKEGRYVPIEKIGNTGNTINENVLKMAQNPINKRAKVVNTYRRKSTIIYKKRASRSKK